MFAVGEALAVDAGGVLGGEDVDDVLAVEEGGEGGVLAVADGSGAAGAVRC